MKTKLSLTALLFYSFYLLSSQVPQGFNYQAIARDGSGNPITNATIKVKLSILTDTTGFYVSGGGTYLWEEEQINVKTNAFGLFTVVLGNPLASKVQGSAASFSAIDWAKSPLFIGTKIANPTDYKNLGTAKLWSVPYSMVSDSTKALLKGSKLSVVSNNDVSTDALFEVKRKDGQTVFAVYPNAVNVYVPRTTPKGVKGGFAIGGFDGNKISPQDYLRVTPDSVRIYIDKTPNLLKGATKGGFAIGGFDQAKNTNPQDLLTVSNDSIRMYINDLPSKGVTKGGFAIGGFDNGKGNNNFLNVATETTGIINPSQNRILWYPTKNAFLTGKVLIEKPDSVGVNSFATGYESKAKGQYSQALGYQAIARGDYSTAIGKNAVASKINSFAFGENAKAKNEESYAIGRGAIAEGFRSFAFGSSGIDSAGQITGVAYAKGDYSFAIGQGSQALATGSFALGIADTAFSPYSFAFGYKTSAKGYYATSFGGFTKASGIFSTAIGEYTTAGGWGSISLGSHTTATGDHSFAEGLSAQASGWNSISMGSETKASGDYSTALGYSTIASGWNSISMGRSTNAFGSYTTAMGDHTIASGWNSISMGRETKATGDYSAAIGFLTNASGFISTSMGRETKAKSYASLAIGMFNDTTCSAGGDNSWNWSDAVFIIGNGTGDNSRSNAFTVLQNGNTAIGHASPTQMLDVNGNARFRAVGTGTPSSPLYITSTGILSTSTSDVSMKKDIVPIGQALQKVLGMNGVYFSWKNDILNDRRVGFIAQEMEKVLPEVVFTNPVDGLKGINYPEITAVLAQAVKEQQKQIEEQNQKIDNQQKEIDELRSLVNTLVANQTGQGK